MRWGRGSHDGSLAARAGADSPPDSLVGAIKDEPRILSRPDRQLIRPTVYETELLERVARLERALRLARRVLTHEEHGVHDAVTLIDNALAR